MKISLHFQRSGEGTPFVFQHGLAAQLAQPQALLADLPGRQLISMDCPGHGQAPIGADDVLSFDAYADGVLRLLDRLQIERAIWGGISMGSGIALNVALRFPERVQALVLVRPAWLDFSTPENLKILLDAAELMPSETGLEQFNSLNYMRELDQLLPKAAQSIRGVFAPTQNDQLPRVLRSMINDCPFKSISDLSRVQVPCLIVGNDDDPLHPFEFSESIHSAMEGSQLAKVTSRYVDDSVHRHELRLAVEAFLAEAC